MELPLRKDILSGWIQRHPLVNIRFFVAWDDPVTGRTIGGLELPYLLQTGQLVLSPQGYQWTDGAGTAGATGGLGGLGGFGLSNIRVGMSGEVERARLDILERMRRTTDSRAKSRLTLPRLFGDGKTETNILADVL